MKTTTVKTILLVFLSLINLNIYSQTIVNWSFPNNPDDAIADAGITSNIAKTISTVGGTSVVDFAATGVTTNAANASGWDSGSGIKYWQVDFVTTGYSNILISSAQRSSNTGPKDFRLEYKVGAGAWTVVTGGTILIANNWTSGVLTSVALPAACDNQAQVFLRWILTSNTAVGGAACVSTGTSRIDNILVTGTCSAPTPACATYSLPVNSSSVCTSGQTLSWSALSTPTCGSISYDVYFNTGSSATSLVSAAQAGTTYATGALTNGTTYAWKIVPKNGAVSAAGCSTYTFIATNPPAPSCATYSLPTNGSSVCSTSQTLSWSAVATPTCGSITYDVYFNTGTSATTLVSASQTGTTYVTGGLISNSTYAWKIVPKNGSAAASGCSTYTFSTNTPTPSCATYSLPTNSSTVCPVSQTLSWASVPTPSCGSITYDVYFNTGTTATTLVSAAQTGTTFATGGLVSNTIYAWKIVPKNGTTSASSCSTYTFATNSSATATVPVSDNFESCFNWTTVNGGQTNIWAIGTATNNGGAQSVYITNDGGITNAYSNTTSRVHFYKDITFPAGLTCINLSFDWKSNGESNTDFLAVFAIPTTSNPIAGTAITSGQLGSNLQLQTTWQTASISLPAAYAGTTQRIVFSWVNNNNTRNQTPAAIDNISITSSNPVAPTCVTYSLPINGTINTCASGQTLSWSPIATPACGSITYDVYLSAGSTATTLVSAAQTGTTYLASALTPGTLYSWKVVPSNGTLTATGCSTYSFTSGSNSVNDICGSATPLTSDVTINDDNSCATADTPLGAATCWSTGTVNSNWYSITVPATGSLSVLTSSLTLVDTQIAVYSGPCGSQVEVACNDNAAGSGCGAATTLNSQLNLTGLAAGTYYIRVDGNLSTTGTYNIMASTSGAVGTNVPVAGSDCALPLSFCSFPITIPNPGYFNTGNICDFDGTGNCIGVGEQNAIWIKFTALTAGQLAFNIIPNDYAGCGTETDYDWVLYRTTGAGATTCANIQATGGGGAIACNWTTDGVTGMSTTFNAPASGDQPNNGTSGFSLTPSPGVGCYNAGYEPSITAAVNDDFVLVVQNFSGSNIGFSLTVPITAGIATIGNTSPSSIMWTSLASTTTFSNALNWSNCSVPSCTPAVDAIVLSGPTNQPVVNINTSVKSMTINPSATLTINSGIVLDVCGNFVNNGTLICATGSTINFSGSNTQIVSGNFTGANKFSNFYVNKTGGSVSLLSNIEVGQDFTTANATSIVNTNGTDITVSRDFINSNGATTFTGISSTSSLFFNGTGAQIYNPNKNAAAPTLTLCNVIMNNTSTGLTLSTTNTPSLVLNTSGVLTLTSGKIITPGLQEVIVSNTANTAVSSGNTSSYVEGNLRRYLAAGATGSFDFPVGHATPGYERANLYFTTAASASALNLLARFDTWGGTWTQPAAPNWSECGTIYDLSYLNNGYWSIDASSVSTGSYSLTLYNRGQSNATGSSFTIAKSPSIGPAWALNGSCVASPVTALVRGGMSGFSKMATVQGTTPMPVELISFTGNSEGTHNSISWKSAVEVRFKQYELESSEDGINFTKIVTVAPLANLSTYNNYNFLDFNYYAPITYYRLKMVDLDYTYTYSSIIAIEYGHSKTQSIVVYPNPASNELFIKLAAQGEKTAQIDIRDILGRIIYQQNIDLTKDIENTYINTAEFATGTYILTVTCGNKISENIKIIINQRN